jgi:hypothetical protein
MGPEDESMRESLGERDSTRAMPGRVLVRYGPTALSSSARSVETESELRLQSLMPGVPGL